MENITKEMPMTTDKDSASTKEISKESWTAQEKEQSRSLYGCEIIQENCNQDDAKNSNLPSDSFLVTYVHNYKVHYDIIRSIKISNIFDMYYDKFGKNLQSIEYTQGRINPKVWRFKAPEKKKRK
jgi:hypothetical protein